MHDMKNVVAKWISKEDFRRIALESCSTVHLEGGPMTFLESYPAIHLGGLSNRFYKKSILYFQEQKPFVLKTVFSHSWLRHA